MFKLNADDRLVRWRTFRKSLDHLPLDKAVQEVMEFWEHCPFAPYYLDPAKPEEWPDPWQLVEENWYCDLAKALGILYTIKFTAHNPAVEIRTYHDNVSNFDYNLVWINDGKYVLNMDGAEVVNKTQIDASWKLRKVFQEADLKIDNY